MPDVAKLKKKAAELELKKHGAKPVKVEQKVTAKWIEACK